MELELVSQLELTQQSAISPAYDSVNETDTHSHHIVKVHSFIAVVVDLDFASKNINERFPLKVLWEVGKPVPFTSKSFGAVLVLALLDLASLVVARARTQWK